MTPDVTTCNWGRGGDGIMENKLWKLDTYTLITLLLREFCLVLHLAIIQAKLTNFYYYKRGKVQYVLLVSKTNTGKQVNSLR